MTDTKKSRTPKQDCIYVLINGAIRIPVKPLEEASLSDAKILLAKIKEELQDTIPFGSEITFSDPKAGKMDVPPEDSVGEPSVVEGTGAASETVPVRKDFDLADDLPVHMRKAK